MSAALYTLLAIFVTELIDITVSTIESNVGNIEGMSVTMEGYPESVTPYIGDPLPLTVTIDGITITIGTANKLFNIDTSQFNVSNATATQNGTNYTYKINNVPFEKSTDSNNNSYNINITVTQNNITTTYFITDVTFSSSINFTYSNGIFTNINISDLNINPTATTTAYYYNNGIKTEATFTESGQNTYKNYFFTWYNNFLKGVKTLSSLSNS